MMSRRSQLIALIEQGAIPPEKISVALVVAKIRPDSQTWRAFMNHLLLWLGGLALTCSVLFFVAYNWADMDRFAKFGMMEALIGLSIALYCKLDERTAGSDMALIAATIFLGVLLGLFGQTYQTGADTWELFFIWALLMLPWALIGRFAAIWIVWIWLINISIGLYGWTFPNILRFMGEPATGLFWQAFFVNTLVLAVWEFSSRRWSWLAKRWAVRLIALGSGIPLSALVLDTVFSDHPVSIFPGLVWVAWLAAFLYIYREKRPDLFMLALFCLSIITVSISFIGKHLLTDYSPPNFLMLALMVLGMGAGAAVWLKKVHQEIQS